MKFTCVFVTFPCGVLGQVWHLVVLIPDLCLLTSVPIRRCLFIDHIIMVLIIWPCHEETCLRDFQQSQVQTSLLSYRDYLENRNFARKKSRYDTFQ